MNSELYKNLEEKEITIDGMTKIALIESSLGVSTIVLFIAIYLGIIFLIASSAILALKQLTESSDNKQRYTILRKIGADEKMINGALFKQIGIFFLMPLILAIINSIFGIPDTLEYNLSVFSSLFIYSSKTLYIVSSGNSNDLIINSCISLFRSYLELLILNSI